MLWNAIQGDVPPLLGAMKRHATRDSMDDELIRLVADALLDQTIQLEFHENDQDEAETIEGRIKNVEHRSFERDRDGSFVRRLKEKWFANDPDLRCRGCGFSFREEYGDRGEGFIEAHHTIPISELDGETPTTTSDLVPLCANCHRMVHRYKPWLTLEELWGLTDL